MNTWWNRTAFIPGVSQVRSKSKSKILPTEETCELHINNVIEVYAAYSFAQHKIVIRTCDF